MANLRVGRRSGLVLRGGRNRRDTLWGEAPFQSIVIGTSATAFLTRSLSAAALDLIPFTIIRVRMRWQVISDQSAATEFFIGNVGWAVVSQQAVGVGVSAVPTPATDLSSDKFFLIDQWLGEFDFIGTGTANQSLADKVIDSKAMRKVEDGENIIETVEAGLGGSGCVVSTVGRFLIKLH